MDTHEVESDLLEDLHNAVAKCEGHLSMITIIGCIECLKSYVLNEAEEKYRASQRREKHCFAPQENN